MFLSKYIHHHQVVYYQDMVARMRESDELHSGAFATPECYYKAYMITHSQWQMSTLLMNMTYTVAPLYT